MLVKKKFVFLLTMAALVTACGGGGDSPQTTNNNTNGGTQAGGSSAPADNSGNNNPPPATGINPPPTTGDNNTPPDNTGGETVTDQKLAGHLSLVANQLVYLRTNRAMFHAISLDTFESDEGMFDVASGSATDDPEARVPQRAEAPAAPVAAFGFRVNKYVQSATGGPLAGIQTVVGRVAFSFTERADSPAIGANEVAESIRIVIDGVELKTDESGQLISAKVRTGAQMHIVGRNAANQQVSTSIAVPEDAVTLLDMVNVLDHLGDTSSVVLLVSLENAFANAGEAVAALNNFRGHFSMQTTLSAAQIVRPAEAGLERKDLIGQPIMVNNQPEVAGAGVSGNVWVRWYPPAASGS